MTKSGITIGSTSAGLAYSEYRFYNGTITISSTAGNITKVVFTCTENKYVSPLADATPSTGSFSASGTTVTWTGSSSSFTIRNTAQTRASKIVVTTASSTPTLTTTTSEIDFSNVAINSTSTQTFTFSGSNLTADATLAITGTNESYFSVNTTTVPPSSGSINNKSITVTYKPTAIGAHTAILTISSTKATSKTIELKGNALQEHTVKFFSGGEEVSSKNVLDGSTIGTLPSATSCDQTNYPYFIGWTEGTIDGTTTTKPTIITTSTTIKENKEYHAVFADKQPSSGTGTAGSTTFAPKGTSKSSPWSDNGSIWTFSNITFANDVSAGFPKNGTATVTLPTGAVANTITITRTGNSWSSKISLLVKTGSSTIQTLTQPNTTTTINLTSANQKNTYTFSHNNAATNVAYVDNIKVNYTIPATPTIVTYITSCSTQTVVTLNPNGGTISASGWTQNGTKYTQTIETTDDVSLPTPTKTGYTFGGWYESSTFSGSAVTKIEAGTTGTKEFWAKWTAEQYTVQLDNQGATTAGATSVTATYNAAMPSIANNLPKKTGSTFLGYFTATSGGTKYYNADGTSAKNWDKTSTATLYAQWECVTPTISTQPQSATYLRDDVADALSVVAAASDATLTYQWQSSTDNSTWSDITGATEATYKPSTQSVGTTYYQVVVTNSEGNCSATSDVATITVRSANCKWVETEIGDIESGDKVVIAMTKSGSTWALNSSNGTNTYPYAEQITTENQTIVSVVSDPIIWNISGNATDGYVFYPNGSTATWLYCTGSNNTVKVGTGTAKTFYIENNYLKNTQKFTVSGVQVDAYVGVSISTSSWRHYPTTTGTSVIADQTLKFYKKECLPIGQYWINYELTDVVCTDNPVKNKISTDDNAVELNFEATGEHNELPTTIIVTNGSTTLTVNTDYTWNNATGVLTLNPSQITDNITISIAAQKRKYTVTFNANGHGTAPAAQSVTAEETVSEPTTEPTAIGYTFGGWYKETTCTTAFDFATPITSDIILYAKWTINQYTVTLHPNYPTGKTGTFKDKEGNPVEKIELKYDYYTSSMDIVDLYESIELEGYQLNAWYSATSGGSKWTSTGIITKNVTLYAQWSKLHTITFNTGTNNPTVDAMEGTSETGITLPVGPAPVCPDWTFAGWATSSVAETTIEPTLFAEGTNYKPAGNCTLYAVYSQTETNLGGGENSATLTFDNTSKRTEFTTEKQVWTENGITLTNIKGTQQGAANVGDYSNPARLYKGSTTLVETSNEFLKIVFTCSSSAYANVLANTIGNTAESSESIVTVASVGANSYAIPALKDQVRLNSITVTYTASGTSTTTYNSNPNCTPPAEYTITWWANGEKYRTQTVVEGTVIKVPTPSPDAAVYACDDKVFVGWIEYEIDEATDEEPTFITDFDKITENKDYFAVFATETSAGVESTIHTLTPSNSWNGYQEGTIKDDKDLTWSYCAGGQQTSGVYSLNLRNQNTEISYIASPVFAANVKNIKATIVNGSASKARKVYVCSAPTLEPKTGDLGITEVAGGYRGELSLAFEGTISQFYLQVSDALQFQSIVVEVGATTTYSGYVTTCEAATEALSGTFSVGKYEVAQFATGNLQYKPSTKTWRFAKQQYQYVGKDNIYVGKEDYKGWIDLFGWSADGNFGVNPSNKKDDYTNQFVDWGTLFPEEGWSTLSKNQWNYLLNERPNYSKLKQIAMVGEILGIMLFPDEWTLPAGCAPTEQAHHDDEDGEDHSCDFVSYNYTLAQWTELEKAGAIFLPAAGRRTGGWGNETISPHMIDKAELDADGHYKHYADYYAYYWTSTKTSDKVNYLINCTLVDKVKDTYTVHAGHVDWAEEARYGQSVRLAKVTSTLIEIGGDDNSEVIEANEDEIVNVKVNRTFKANDGYYTICLPFDLAAEKIGKAYQINTVTEHVAGEGINVEFTPADILQAGQPYLLLPSKNLENPIFEGVTIVNTTGDAAPTVSGEGINIAFTGIINGGGETNGTSEYYVGDKGYLYNGTTAKLGLRAFFTITDNNGNPAKVRARVVVGENTTTGVDNSQLPITNIQKVFENGQLIIIRNGEKFNAQGQKL